MHLKEIIENTPIVAPQSVPEWTIGCFKRRSISFANGLTDTDTIVYWLQSRNFTIDLRLPLPQNRVSAKPFSDYSEDELLLMADYEGWVADTHWQDGVMSWSGGSAFQIHNRWSEPGYLSRVGNCLIENCPSGIYIEDWRLQNNASGPLVGLRLIEEKDQSTGKVLHRDGGLIINGEYAALVRGRPVDLPEGDINIQLRDLLKKDIHNKELNQQVFQFETSVATGDIDSGFHITDSLNPNRVNQLLISLDGFERIDEKHLQQNEGAITRTFAIDTLEPAFPYAKETPAQQEGVDWFTAENQTLGRYLQYCR